MEKILSPIKVLHMTMLGAGGISTLIVNINKAIDLDKVKFDYLVFRNQKEFYEDEILELGEKKIIADTSKIHNKFLLYFEKYYKTKKLLKRNCYDVMHVNATTPLDFVIGLAAKQAHVKKIVIHSHNTGDVKRNIFIKLAMNICKCFMPYIFTSYLTTSVEAAKFMFPKSIVKNARYTIIRNGIYSSKYLFDERKRKEVRSKLNLNDSFVLGHIGRFSPQKNHEFIVDVFFEIKNRKKDSKLLLIGSGNLEETIEDKVKNLGLLNDVIFYGLTTDIPAMLCSFDAFIFPSRWEGLGIAGIEAQCSGLKTYCSRNIPEEARVTDLFIRILSDEPSIWAEKILADYNNNEQRIDRICDIKNAGFDIQRTADDLQTFYLN